MHLGVLSVNILFVTRNSGTFKTKVNGTKISIKISRKIVSKLLHVYINIFWNANHSTTNSRNFNRKIKWNRNSLSKITENWGSTVKPPVRTTQNVKPWWLLTRSGCLGELRPQILPHLGNRKHVPYFYNSIQTWRTCFLFLFKNTAKRKRKTTC